MRGSDIAMEYALKLLGMGVLEIDQAGRIWRTGELRSGIIKPVNRRTAESYSKKGHKRLMFSIPGHRGTKGILSHRVVWTWLHGPIPEAMQVNHINMVKDDNRPENLELLTNQQNTQHGYDNGRRRPWAFSTDWRDGQPRWTEADYERWRSMRDSGMTQAEICKAEGVSRTHLQRILYRKAVRDAG